MKAIIWILAFLLLPVLIIGSLFLVANQTILNTSFVKTELVKVNLYADLASYLPNQITNSQTLAPFEKQQTTKELSNVLTPQYLQQKVENIIDQAANIANGSNNHLTIDFSDVTAKLQAEGLPIQSDTIKPINFSLTDQPRANTTVKGIDQAKIWLPIEIIAGLLLVIGLSYFARSLTALIFITFLTALFEFGLFFGTRIFLSNQDQIFNTIAPQNDQIAHFRPLITQMLTDFGQRAGTLFGWLTVGAIIFAVLLIITQKFLFKSPPRTSI